jgi:hypothetical protein
MTIDKAKSGMLTALFLLVMAFGISAGCSSSEEESPPPGGGNACGCDAGDQECMDKCL